MTDLDDLSLPPRRPLPRDVRDRLRATVLRQPHARPTSNRMALVVAAGVAVLALGATVLTQAVAGSHGTGAAGRTPVAYGTPFDVVAAKADMKRCWTAAQQVITENMEPGITVDVLPPESSWEAVFAATWNGVTVTAVRAAGEPLFCETTRTTVTVSNPHAEPVYAAGSRTAALLASTQGVVAGVMDPEWRLMRFVGTGKSAASISGPSYVVDGMFVEFTGIAGPGTRYRVEPTDRLAPAGKNAILDLPAAPAALVAMVDRPDPPVDRASPAGRALGYCIAHTEWAVRDPDSWGPIEMMSIGNTSLVLASSASSTAVCSAVDDHATDPQKPIDYVFQLTGELTPNKALWTMFDEVVTSSSPAEGWVALGVVRPDVVSGEIILPTGESIPVPIENNTFAAQHPLPPDYTKPWREVTIVLWDRTGHELYHGAVPVGP